MKLLFFINTMEGGGAQRVLSVITSELAKRGHDITISLNWDGCSYEFNPSVKIFVASRSQRKTRKNMIYRIIHYFYNLNVERKHTRNIIRSVKPDVIITFLFCNMYSIVCYHGKIPIIHSEHNAYDRKNKFEQQIKRFYINKLFDKVFVLTSFDYGYSYARGLKNTFIMPNPNTFNCISLEEYEQGFQSRVNILVCGRINQWYIKGFDLAIHTFSLIANQFPEVDLDIAGGGTASAIAELQKIVEKYEVQERVHFLGLREDIQYEMKRHQIFLLSSRTEGFPMVVTEAMSQGTPCVSFEKLANSIIVDGIDGILVKDGDIKEMSLMLCYLLSNDNIRYRLGKSAIMDVSRFSVERIADRWENILMSIS